MRKAVSLAVGLLFAFALIPSASNASTQCPGIDDNPGVDAMASVPHGAVTPSNPTLQAKQPVLFIESGQLLPTYSNPAASDQSSVTGFVNPGQAGCLGYCAPMNLTCAYQQENGVIATNFLTPNATGLQVVAHNYPTDIDDFPDPGCLHFNAAPGSTCKGTGDVKLTWTLQQGSPFHGDGPRFVSKVITIPASATKVIVSAFIVTEKTSPNATKFTTTYTKQTP